MVAVLRPLPDRLALAGLVAAGLSWSLGVVWAHWSEVQSSALPLYQAVLIVCAGGMATIVPLWLAVGAVMWAMCRVCNQRVAFGGLLLTLSASGLSLAVAAPAAALLTRGVSPAAPAITWFFLLIGVGAFCAQVATGLRGLSAGSTARAWGCVMLTGIFCTSFASLYQ